MSTSPPPPPPLFYYPAFWCHSCDMSIGLPPSPTPTALLCPHCHRDSLEQMDLEDTVENPLYMDRVTGPSLTSSDGNFLLDNPYLHRLNHLIASTATDLEDHPSNRAPQSSIDSLQEITIALDDDLTNPCAVCKDPFHIDTVAKLMPCKHMYHSECIVPWLEINNSCPVCRFKLPACEDNGVTIGGDVSGFMRLEEFVDDDVDLYGFRNTLRYVVRRHRWSEEGNVGNGSVENFFSPTQVGEVERGDETLQRENSVETVSSWPRWLVEDEIRGGGGNDNSDVPARN